MNQSNTDSEGSNLDRAPGDEALTLLRQIVEVVDQSPDGRANLSADSLTFSVARRILDSKERHVEIERTALMALRDLVWRIDTAKFFLRDAAKTQKDRELTDMVLEILDTSDIDELVRSPAPDADRSPALPGGVPTK